MSQSPPSAIDTLVGQFLDQINRGLRFDDIFANLYDHIRAAVPCHRVAVALVEPDGAHLRLVAALADGEQALKVGFSDPIAGSTLEELLRTGRPRILNDLPAYLATKPSSRSTRLIVREGMKANLTLPLLADGRPIGVVFFSSREAGVYRDEHTELLKRIAGPLAVSVEKARLVAALDDRNRELAAANELKERFVEKLREEVERQTFELRRAYDEVAALKAQLEQENVLLRGRLRASATFDRLSRLPGLAAVCRAVEQVAAADTTVLVSGETGVGKELVARAVHELSQRRNGLFVPVSCAALPRDLTAAELFGHEAGAFTGAAKRRAGRFELAHRGTLFLDEVGEVPADTQVLLLRALQERVVERVGGGEPIAIDVRLIAATNADLTKAVGAGTFRADLFYRLNVFPLRVPPLRDRKADVPPLVEHFVEQFRTRLGKGVERVAPAALDRLMAHSWPGNVRELENVIERAMVVAAGPVLDVDPAWLSSGPAVDAPWRDRERETIRDALRRAGGKLYGRGGAAELLGLKPTTLASKMKKLGLARDDIS
jgi:transcriptional regulator with GAF, ATPase, and Fis domain